MDPTTVTWDELKAARPDLAEAARVEYLGAIEKELGIAESNLRTPDLAADAAHVAALKRVDDARIAAETERDTLKSAALIESGLREADLPAPMAELVRKGLAGRVVTEDEVKSSIGEAKAASDALMESHRPTGIPGRGAAISTDAPVVGANTLAGLLMPPKAGG